MLVLVVFTNRYIGGTLLKRLRGIHFDEARDGYEPSVSVVVPLFNEGESIRETIRSLLALEYPSHKLDVVVVDDCSSDDSYLWACKAAEGDPRVTVLRNRRNLGKRRSINRAVKQASSEIIVSVDSDVIVQPDAVRQLVRRFVRPEIAAVGGRVNVVNRNDNWLTRMQTIKYFYGYECNKNIERAFRSVLCLSGCLTAYRRSVLLELHPILEDRKLAGNAIKYGEDRFLTRQIVKAGHETVMTLDAVCHARAPKALAEYFSQQLRWRRSNLADYLGGLSHVWKLHPIVALHYFSTAALLLAYPAIVLQKLITFAFWELAVVHLGVAVMLGLVYRVRTRELAPDERVGALCYVGAVLVMPVTYLVLTPLALFTLDTGSWETRGAAFAPLRPAEDEPTRESSSPRPAVGLRSGRQPV